MGLNGSGQGFFTRPLHSNFEKKSLSTQWSFPVYVHVHKQHRTLSKDMLPCWAVSWYSFSTRTLFLSSSNTLR